VNGCGILTERKFQQDVITSLRSEVELSDRRQEDRLLDHAGPSERPRVLTSGGYAAVGEHDGHHAFVIE
jgi:hypothetical protein